MRPIPHTLPVTRAILENCRAGHVPNTTDTAAILTEARAHYTSLSSLAMSLSNTRTNLAVHCPDAFALQDLRLTEAEYDQLAHASIMTRETTRGSITLRAPLETLRDQVLEWVALRPAPNGHVTLDMAKLYLAIQCLAGRRGDELFAVGRFAIVDDQHLRHVDNIGGGKYPTPDHTFPVLFIDTTAIIAAINHLRNCFRAVGAPTVTSLRNRLAYALNTEPFLSKWIGPDTRVRISLGRNLYGKLHAIWAGATDETPAQAVAREKAILGHRDVAITMHYQRVDAHSAKSSP
jgi:hypothetical protein